MVVSSQGLPNGILVCFGPVQLLRVAITDLRTRSIPWELNSAYNDAPGECLLRDGPSRLPARTIVASNSGFRKTTVEHGLHGQPKNMSSAPRSAVTRQRSQTYPLDPCISR